MDAEGVDAAAEGARELLGDGEQPLFAELLPGDEHRELVAAEPAAQAARRIGEFPEHGGGLHQHLVALEHAKKRVDEPIVHDVAGHHHPARFRACLDHLARELVKRIGVEDIGENVMMGAVVGGARADVLGLPVVALGGFSGLADVHEFDHGLIVAAACELERHGLGLNEIVAVLEVLGLFLRAARPAGDRARAVQTLLTGVPDAVAALRDGDPSVILQAKDAALDRIDHACKIVFAGHLLEKGFHLADRVFLRLVKGPAQGRGRAVSLLNRLRHDGDCLRSALFVFVHLLVGLGKKRRKALGALNDSPGDSHRELDAGGSVDMRSLCLQGLEQPLKLISRHVGRDDDKLVSPVSVAVLVPENAHEQFSNLPEQPIAHQMTVRVIDALEFVQVKHRDRD